MEVASPLPNTAMLCADAQYCSIAVLRIVANVALNRSQAAPHRLPSAACSLFRAMARRFPPAALALTRLAPGSRLRATGGYPQYSADFLFYQPNSAYSRRAIRPKYLKTITFYGFSFGAIFTLPLRYDI